MRKYLLILPLLSVLFFSAPISTASAQESPAPASNYGVGRVGLGLILGDPNGIVGKYRFNNLMAIDGVLGFSIFGGGHLYARVDVLWQFNIGQWSAGALDWYVGVGPQIGVFYDSHWGHRDSGLALGARAPIGISWFFSGAPVDLFLEASLGLWFFDHVDFDFGAAIGARYWF